MTSASDNGRRDTSFRKTGSASLLSGISTSSTQRRAPLSVRKISTSNMMSDQHTKSNDWHFEITVPKNHAMPFVAAGSREPSRGCSRNAFDRRTANVSEAQDIKFVYDSIDDKPEYSCVSDLVSESYQMKHLSVPIDCPDDNDSTHITVNNNSAVEDIGAECPGNRERKSLDSTVTDLCSHSMHGCCLQAANELAVIKQQLVEIETKQSNLLDLLQVIC